MLSARTRSLFFVASLTLVAACGDSSTATFGGYVDAYSAKRCEQFFRCEQQGEDVNPEASRVQYTQADCRAAADEPSTQLEAQIAAGTVKYDESAAKECLASFSDLCAGGEAEACDAVLVGQVADGGACADDRECVSERCSSNGFQCGTCATVLADGAPCGAPGTVCDYNSYCPLDCVCTPDTFNYEFVSTQVGFGEACGNEFTDAGVVSKVCGPNLYCDPESEFCVNRLAIGLRCDEGTDTCVTGAVCGGLTAETRCLEAVVTRVVGADCGATDATTYTVCDPDARLECDGEVCVALGGNGGVGSECNDDSDCKNGKCSWYTDECVAGDLENGASCFTDNECQSNVCNYTGGAGAVCGDPLICN